MDPCVCLEEIGLLHAQNMMLNHSRLNTQHNSADLYYAHLMSPTIFTLTNEEDVHMSVESSKKTATGTIQIHYSSCIRCLRVHILEQDVTRFCA
jgi:hypothetical protein